MSSSLQREPYIIFEPAAVAPFQWTTQFLRVFQRIVAGCAGMSPACPFAMKKIERVYDWMSRSLFTVSVDATLATATETMRFAHARHVPVVKDGVPVGMLSLRDLLRAQLPVLETKPKEQRDHLDKIHASQFMHPVFAIDVDASLGDAAERMWHEKISSLAVVHDHKLVGVLTTTDLLRYVLQLLAQETNEIGRVVPVERFMTHSPITTVSPTERLDLSRLLMRFGQFRHLPVIKDEKLVGIISDRDLLSAFDSSLSTKSKATQLIHDGQITVAEIMTTKPRTVKPDAEAARAATLLVKWKIGALPVMRGSKLVGIITERDFMSYLTASAPQAVRQKQADA